MVQIVGKYQYVSGENFEEYVKSLGKAELIDAFLHSSLVVEIQQNGDQWLITINNKGKSATSTFKVGEAYEETMPSQGLVFKSVTTREGDCFRTETSLSAEIKVIRLYEFKDDGMTVHLSSNISDVKAKRMYKRL